MAWEQIRALNMSGSSFRAGIGWSGENWTQSSKTHQQVYPLLLISPIHCCRLEKQTNTFINSVGFIKKNHIIYIYETQS